MKFRHLVFVLPSALAVLTLSHVRAASLPISPDPGFGSNGQVSLGSDYLPSRVQPGFTGSLKSINFDSIRFTADQRLTLFGSALLGGYPRPGNYVVEDIIASLEPSGLPRAGFGVGGLRGESRNFFCRGAASLAADAVGTVSVAIAGGGGSRCQTGITELTRVDAKGSLLSRTFFRSGSASKQPGLAFSARGSPVVATINQDTSEVDFYRYGLDDPAVPTSRWKTGAEGSRVLLREVPNGGFIAAYADARGLQLMRLDDDAQPISAFGSTTKSGLTILEPETKSLLALETLGDGTFAAIVETASEIKIHFVNAKGSTGWQRIPTEGVKDWVAAIHANGDAVVSAATNSGTLKIVRSRRANFLALPYVFTDFWEWKPSFPIFNAMSVAAHPNQEFAYVSFSTRSSPESGEVVDGALARFDLAKATPASAVNVVAFYNAPLNHYFVSGGSGEIISVESGGAGPGWTRTSGGFKAFDMGTGVPASAKPVCRFYGTPDKGPNSHFYTFFGAECDAVKKDPGWTFEGIAFFIYPPSNGTCATGQAPVYRAYNNGFARNDSNHRYSTDQVALKAMSGWTLEGVVFCSPL